MVIFIITLLVYSWVMKKVILCLISADFFCDDNDHFRTVVRKVFVNDFDEK